MLDALEELVGNLVHELWQQLDAVDYNELLFLPPGKGPSILILGGITMLAVSLSLALRVPRARPPSAAPPTGSARRRAHQQAHQQAHEQAHQQGTQERQEAADERTATVRPPEVDAALEAASEVGLEDPRVLSTEADRHRVGFLDCPSARGGGGSLACTGTRERLENALARRDTEARVACTGCQRRGARSCVFEILTEEDTS